LNKDIGKHQIIKHFQVKKKQMFILLKRVYREKHIKHHLHLLENIKKEKIFMMSYIQDNKIKKKKEKY